MKAIAKAMTMETANIRTSEKAIKPASPFQRAMGRTFAIRGLRRASSAATRM
jgi:hypothetical protein